MSATRRAASVAWSAWAVALALAAGEVVFVTIGGQTLEDPLAIVVLAGLAAAFATLGALVAGRRPGNTVGWLLLTVGVLLAATGFAGRYALYGLVVDPGALPAAVGMAWLWNWAWWLPLSLAATFALLLFPDGRLPSRRWRPVGWACGAVVAAPALLMAVRPGPYDELEGVANPLGIAALEPLVGPFGAVMFAALGGCALACAASLILRFNRSRGDERQQLKWVAYATALVVAGQAVTGVVELSDQALDALLATSAVLWGGAVSVAILRYRLYDIDRIVSRTVTYGLLTVLLGAVYAVGVPLLSSAVGAAAGESQLAVAGATLAVATLFRPARRRVQQAVDRRFNRTRYDAHRTVEAFTVRVRNEVGVQQASAGLLEAASATVEPAGASLWLREPEARVGEPRAHDAHPGPEGGPLPLGPRRGSTVMP